MASRPLAGLTRGAVIVLDEQDLARHAALVSEITHARDHGVACTHGCAVGREPVDRCHAPSVESVVAKQNTIRLKEIDLEILYLLREGRTNQEIADSLALTMSSTRWRINQIFEKLQARNRMEAIGRSQALLASAPTTSDISPTGPMPEPLREIELAILRLLKLGMNRKEIAIKLAMTLGTIKWYLTQIYGKLQVRNRIEALARAGEHDWL